MRVWTLVFGLLLTLSDGAEAAIVTFDGISGLDDDGIWIEDGITVQANDGRDLGRFGTTIPSVHIDDGGSTYARLVTLTMSAAFDAISMDLIGMGSTLFEVFQFDPISGVGGYRNVTSLTYDNVVMTGYRNGSIVAQSSLYAGDKGTLSTFLFGDAFRNLDSLVIGAGPVPHPVTDFTLEPNGDLYTHLIRCGDNPCAHFSIDGVVLAPNVTNVPLPASLPLALTGLVIIALIGARNCRNSVSPIFYGGSEQQAGAA